MTVETSKSLKALPPARRSRGSPAGAARPDSAQDRREHIVRLAAPLFLKKGYDNVTIDEIIGVAGGSKATIYAWFGGKQGLFEAVVRQKCEDVTLALDVEPKGSIEDQLARIGHSFLAMVLSPPILEFHRLMVSIGRTFPEAARLFFQTGPASAYRIVGSWMERQQKEGRLSDGDPYKMAVLFLDMLIGEHQLGRLTSMPHAAQRTHIDETVRLAVNIFLRGADRPK
jgi:TetR/AcrR family transcriptional repressor of mexJK operon